VSESQGRRRIRWLVAAGVLAVLVAWSAVVAAGVWSAYHHDQQGLAELETVRNTTDPTALTASSTRSSLDRASAQFASAHADLSHPWMAPATWLPVLGRQLRSARSLSSAAQQVSIIGSGFLGHVHDVLDLPHGAGPQRVHSLQRLSVLSLATARQLSAIDTGPDQALVAPLARKRNQFVRQLDDARSRLVKAAGVSAVTATILQGPQNYLVLAGNNAEMRAGSGAFLEIGTAATGEVRVERLRLMIVGVRVTTRGIRLPDLYERIGHRGANTIAHRALDGDVPPERVLGRDTRAPRLAEADREEWSDRLKWCQLSHVGLPLVWRGDRAGRCRSDSRALARAR